MSVRIFFCYSREDEILLNALKKQLKPLQRQGLIDVWHDRDITAGKEWEQEINEHLNAAQVILLLISSDFINSDYCYSKEMKRALERHERKEALVIPIILRLCYWQGGPLSKLQALPTDGRPIQHRSWHSIDEALFNVLAGICNSTEELKNFAKNFLFTEHSDKESSGSESRRGQLTGPVEYQELHLDWSKNPLPVEGFRDTHHSRDELNLGPAMVRLTSELQPYFSQGWDYTQGREVSVIWDIHKIKFTYWTGEARAKSGLVMGCQVSLKRQIS